MLVDALVSAGFKVTAITRPDSSQGGDSVVATKIARYDDIEGLTAALQGQDAVIEAFNPAAAVNQGAIVRAALAAGVSHLITPDFSLDTFNQHIGEIFISKPKQKAQAELENLVADCGGSLSWTAIMVGGWYDWGIEVGRFWINKTDRTIMRFGSGNQKYAISRLALTGAAVVSVLKNPGRYKNRPAYFAGHTVTTNQLIGLVKEVAGDDWKVVDVPIDGFVKTGRALWEQDTEKGVEDRMNSQAYVMLGTAAIMDEANRYNADFGDMVEPGWDEGEEALKSNLRRLLL